MDVVGCCGRARTACAPVVERLSAGHRSTSRSRCWLWKSRGLADRAILEFLSGARDELAGLIVGCDLFVPFGVVLGRQPSDQPRALCARKLVDLGLDGLDRHLSNY